MIVDAVEFVRTAVGGVVHVLADRLYLPELDANQHVAVCGRRGRPGHEDLVDVTFDDRELCRDCWLTTPSHHRPRLLAR